MDTEVTFVNNADQRKRIEGVNQEIVKILVILVTDLIVKIHSLSHLHGLMIASQHNDFFGVSQFERHQQDHDFHTHGSPVYVVSEEEHMLFRLGLKWGEETDDLEKVEELSV